MNTEEKGAQPKYGLGKFICPYCKVSSRQKWSHALTHVRDQTVAELKRIGSDGFAYPVGQRENPRSNCKIFLYTPEGRVYEDRPIKDLSFLSCSKCDSCERISLWLKEIGETGEMIYPDTAVHPCLPKEAGETVCALYNEANSISSRSPRAAAALLRTSMEVLCKEILGEKDEKKTSLEKMIVEVANKHHFPDTVKQALEAVRVMGNNALHRPREIEFENDEKTEALFELVQYIVGRAIMHDITAQRLIDVVEGKANSEEKKTE